MNDHVSRRSLLATGGSLFAGGLLASTAGAAPGDADGAVADPPPIRWAERYDQGETDTVQAAIRTSNGNYVVAGQSVDGSSSVNPWVFSVTDRGKRRWQRVVDTDQRAGFNTIVETTDGDLLLGGYRGTARQGQEPLLARMNADRELLWERTVETPREGGNLVSLVPAGDGQYVAGGLARGGTILDVSAWMFGIDGEASRQWSQTFAPRHTNFLVSMTATGDGGYLVGGGTRDEVTEENQQPPFIGWLFEVDGEGTQQWSETYREATDGTEHQLNFVYNVHAADSKYLGIGATSPELLSDQRGWVLSVEAGGQRREQLQTQPEDTSIAQLRGVQPFEDGYALVGSGRAGQTDPASVWALGVDSDLTEQWSATKQYANGSQASRVLGTDDDGLLIFGTANVEGGQTSTDALALQLGGDPVQTPSPTPTPTATDTETPTPSPTETPTETPSPSPTPSPTPAGTAMPTETPTDEPAETTADDGAGFGVGTALVALGGGVLARRARQSRGGDRDADTPTQE